MRVNLNFIFCRNSKNSEMNLQDKIPLTDLTVGQVISLMDSAECAEWQQMAGVNGGGVNAVRVETLSGKGLASTINRLTFQWAQGGGNCAQFPVILKYLTTAHLADEADAQKCAFYSRILASFHRREVHFYERIAARHFGKFPQIARVFAHKDCAENAELDGAFLLMEDLSTGGVHQEPEAKGFNERQVHSMVQVLARIHAESLRIAPALMEEQSRLAKSHFLKNVEGTLKGLLALPAPFGPYFEANAATLSHFLEQTEPGGSDFDFALAEKHGVSPKVLSHGDMWTNNLLFERNSDGQAGDRIAAILDWQCAHPSTGLNDLCRFILFNVDAQLRMENEQKWIGTYREVFERSIHTHVAADFPLRNSAKFQQIYDEQFGAELHQLMAMEVFLGSQQEYDMRQHGQLRTASCHRMVAAFEQIRANYET